MELLKQLNWRYATKKFDDQKKLPQEIIQKILESATLTASSYGLQPWKVIVVNSEALRGQLMEQAYGQPQIKDASHLLVITRHKDINAEDVEGFVENIIQTRNVEPAQVEDYKQMMLNTVNTMSDEDKAAWMAKQSYIVMGNLLTTCAVYGVDSCPMEGFNPEGVDQVLGLGEKGLTSTLLLPIGYRAEDDAYQFLKKVRKPFEDVIVQL